MLNFFILQDTLCSYPMKYASELDFEEKLLASEKCMFKRDRKYGLGSFVSFRTPTKDGGLLQEILIGFCQQALQKIYKTVKLERRIMSYYCN